MTTRTFSVSDGTSPNLLRNTSSAEDRPNHYPPPLQLPGSSFPFPTQPYPLLYPSAPTYPHTVIQSKIEVSTFSSFIRNYLVFKVLKPPSSKSKLYGSRFLQWATNKVVLVHSLPSSACLSQNEQRWSSSGHGRFPLSTIVWPLINLSLANISFWHQRKRGHFFEVTMFLFLYLILRAALKPVAVTDEP